MGFLAKLLLGPLGPYLAGGVGLVVALALAFGGIQTLRLNHTKHDLASTRAALAASEQRVKALSEAREADQQAAATDATQTQATCVSERASAVRSGRAIERAIHAPSDPAAPRGLVSADELRAIVSEPEADAGLPAKPDR